MIQKTKRIVITGASIMMLTGILLLGSYHWPRTAEVLVVSTEVKRVGDGAEMRDQYRITVTRVDNGKRMVLRNEDAWYRFKFNSADLQGDAAINERNQTPVHIRYYGWRSNLMSWFWNVSELKALRAGAD